jgi:3,4-dihydroxy 2-butanone 4-phosphate synthase / GTP cyclohydrolase II
MFTHMHKPPKRLSVMSRIEDAIDDIRTGKMVILMDDENRENEGDLCMAAEKVTPEAINFMARHARGLICLALSEERVRDLGLSMMVSENRAPLGTAFTVSIDARFGISSGVSAQGRALTIRTAVADATRPEDLVSPGHVFPLRARPGGVLVRTGQTEGSVDLARLAGLKPAAVICEIMNEDGTMARLRHLERFATTHGLKICTVADLIQYRLRCDSLVRRVAEADVPTRFGGVFRAYVYDSEVDTGEHLVLVKGQIKRDEPVLVRAHTEYLPGDIFGSVDRDTGGLLRRAMEIIAGEGRGVILYLRRERQAAELQGRRSEQHRPSTESGLSAIGFREYGIGAQILRDVGVGKMRLLTNHPRRLVSLPGYGLEVVDCVALQLPLREPPSKAAPAPKRRHLHAVSHSVTPKRRSTSKV